MSACESITAVLLLGFSTRPVCFLGGQRETVWCKRAVRTCRLDQTWLDRSQTNVPLRGYRVREFLGGIRRLALRSTSRSKVAVNQQHSMALVDGYVEAS